MEKNEKKNNHKKIKMKKMETSKKLAKNIKVFFSIK